VRIGVVEVGGLLDGGAIGGAVVGTESFVGLW